jgi:hypothetical protein
MRFILITGMLLLLPSNAHSQQTTADDTVNVPANGRSGGQNPSIWRADCQKGMVMTGIEIVVGGTCQNQCNADGRPVATYRIHCSPMQAGSPTNLGESQ